MTADEPTAAGRAARAEAELREALRQRNELWKELQRRNSTEQDLTFWRDRAEGIERSRWWKAGRPLRLAKRLLADPAGALNDASVALRERRRRP